MFTGRLKTDLPKSLQELVVALKGKAIVSLDLSDNAFGPIGVASFDFYLIQCSSLKMLYVENNGLGPEGAENLAKALLSSSMTLEELRISRNRLENKGAIAISK
jgi:Ran GTPase-activating protein 1